MRVTLAELGHHQPAQGTPLFNDNATTTGILNATMRQKLSKSFDMQVYWVRDCILQKQYQLIWRKGITNMADYFTKHHPPWHHKMMRYKYLHKALYLKAWHPCEGVLLPPGRSFHVNHAYGHPRPKFGANSASRPKLAPSVSSNYVLL